MIGQAISYGAGESNFYFKNAYVNMLWPSWAVGIYRGLNHALGFAGFWVSGRVLDRIKAPHFLAFREVYWFISQTIAILMSNVATPLLMLTGAAIYGPGEIARDQILQKEFSDSQRATMGSVGTFLGSVVYAIMALFIGIIADRFGIAAGVGFGVLVNVTSLPIYIYLFRRYF